MPGARPIFFAIFIYELVPVIIMNKTLTLGIALSLLVLGTPMVYALDQAQTQAMGIAPDSPFYFFKGWMEGFNGIFRGGDPAFHEELAQIRQIEMQYLQERNQSQLIEQLGLRERLQEQQQEAQRIRTEQQTRAGEGSGTQTEQQTMNEGQTSQTGSGTQGGSTDSGSSQSGTQGQQSGSSGQGSA